MADKEDYLTTYREFFEKFAATVNPEDQLPVHVAGYSINDSELPGEVLFWTTQYLIEKQCPEPLMTPLCRIILDEVQTAAKKQPNEFGYKPDESVYIGLRLMQAVTARANAVCLRYLDNSQLDALPPPHARPRRTTSAAIKNSRRVMEDRHVEVPYLEDLFAMPRCAEGTGFYAVYDGHAGSAAATYCAAHLHQYLCESAHFTTDLRAALRDAFLRTDQAFVRKTTEEERVSGGSTAVAVAIRGRTLYAAWAGDSQALLAKRMRLMQLVHPHKPDREDERTRIESSGGTVMFWGTWRVNGQLAVSRAIGDAQYKPYVTAKPELATVELDGDEDFVVVACDGLWDFVSEDQVALTVYWQLSADPDDLKAVTKQLISLAKRQGSADNISVIVVFLKEPRDIVADNPPPMDVRLESALASAPPCGGVEVEGRTAEAEAVALPAGGGEQHQNGVRGVADADADDSEGEEQDLGPETAVDALDPLDLAAEELDMDTRPEPSTPPAHTVHSDNVAESGEDSEDEWNYFKGEQKAPEPGLEPERDFCEPAANDSPCQDNSAWETSSGDMNSSPLNPEAPVFVPGAPSPVPGALAAADPVIAESPRKPLPMDDIEVPDEAQFDEEATARPNDQLLDNCDQLNGHHNVSLSEKHLNGNDKLDVFGLGLNTSLDGKIQDSGLLQDFERVQKDTTDFIQVSYAHTETDPVGVVDEELFERLKSKERDPMSMSFYQEKDHDTQEPSVDLNAVQQLPDSEPDDDDEISRVQPGDNDKENFPPDNDAALQHIAFDNQALFNNDNPFAAPIASESTLQTETPESHKLLFEQIPEIPDGKSSELGFASGDVPEGYDNEVEMISPLPQSGFELQENKATPQPTEDNKETHDAYFSTEVADEVIAAVKSQDSNVPQADLLAGDGFEFDMNIATPEVHNINTEFEIEKNLHELNVDNLHKDNESELASQVFNEFVDRIATPEHVENKDVHISSGIEAGIQHFEQIHEAADKNDGSLRHDMSDLGRHLESINLDAKHEATQKSNCDNLENVIPDVNVDLIETAQDNNTGKPTEMIFNINEASCHAENAKDVPSKDSSSPFLESLVNQTPDVIPEVEKDTSSVFPTEPIPDKDVELSRAQEICVPVTNEIQSTVEDLIVEPACGVSSDLQPTATPPPTPAVDFGALSQDPFAKHEEPLPEQDALESKLVEAEPKLQSVEIKVELNSQTTDLQETEQNTDTEHELPAPQISEPEIQIAEFMSVSAEPKTEVPEPQQQPVETNQQPVEPETKIPEPGTQADELKSQIAEPEPAVVETGSTADSNIGLTEAAIASAVAATGVAAAAVTIAAAKPRTPASAKKPTSNKASASAPKTTAKPTTAASKTTTTTVKKSTPTTPTTQKTPLAPKTSATKPPISKPSLTKAPTPKTSVTTKTPSPAVKDTTAPKTAATTKPAPAKTITARPTSAPRPTAAKTSTTTSAPKPSAPISARSAPSRPLPTARSTSAATTKPKPVTVLTTKPAEKTADKKPLTNGDARPALKKTTSSSTTARPAPRPATAPAPRTTARAPGTTAPTKTDATTQNKGMVGAPKPAPRATGVSAPRAALDKPSKDLANKRLSAATKTAPPRTTAAAAKMAASKTAAAAAAAAKGAPIKKPPPIRRPVVESEAPAEPVHINGDADVVKDSSPPPQDNALLPDVIA